MTLPELTVYSRPGCHLCEQLLEELLPMVRGTATVQVRDIDADPVLADAYGLKVPVVALGEREICHYHLDRDAVMAALRS